MREFQSVITTLTLSVTRPLPRHATIVTLNADEENATVQAVFLCDGGHFDRIVLVTPSPEVSKVAVGLAARRLELAVPSQIEFRELSYGSLLGGYRRSSETYSTHVLLPGRDFSKRRRHVHLTHGSGPKPDTTFRAPTNILASITPHWVEQQLKEYKLPPDTEVIEYMPRLEIMRRAVGDVDILERLGLDIKVPVIVWAPTYRKVRRGNEVRVSGEPLTISSTQESFALVLNTVEKMGGTLILKLHPHDADDYSQFKIPVHTNSSLRALGLTPYELFGVASLLITDYSSLYLERQLLELPFELIQRDLEVFAASYRGIRQ